MPIDSDKPGANSEERSRASARAKEAFESENPHDGLQPSKPLQVFLLIAFCVSGAAYVVDQYTDTATQDTLSRPRSSLHRLVENQSQYLTNITRGLEAENKKKYEEAVFDYRRALLGQDKPEGHLHLGHALLKEGNLDMAFSQFTEATRQDPSYEPVYVMWGQELKREGKLDDAVQLYEDALRHNTNFAEVQYNFALVLEQKQQNAEAARRAAETAGDPQRASQSAAEAQLFELDAVKHFQAAEKLGLKTPDFWCGYGTLLNQQGKFDQAETCLSNAIAQKPDFATAQFQLALADDHLGKYADAIAHYEATLALIPDDTATLNNLALLYASATNQEARSSKMAVLLATRATDATTDQNARYMDTLARAYASDGDFNQAVTWEDRAVRRAAQLGNHELLRELQPRFNRFLQHRTD